MGLSVGDVLDGKYRVLRVIGEGGMGTVYEGEHTRIKRRIAIKALLQNKNAEEIIRRFEHEAQAAGRIGNEHILEVLDMGTLPTGEHYIVMEFLDGQTLAQRLAATGPLPSDQVALIVQQVLVALSAAHGAGIIHRDLKPDNIFILPKRGGQRDFVKLIDFGISKFTGGPDPEAMRVTKLGSLLGTPSYMSPELARGTAEADARTDIYGLGVIMYEAVSGKLPFESTNFNDLLFQIVGDIPKSIQSLVPGLDLAFAAMIMRALEKNPLDRFQTADDFLEELSAWMSVRNIVPLPASIPTLSASSMATPDPRTRATPQPQQKTPGQPTQRSPSGSSSHPHQKTAPIGSLSTGASASAIAPATQVLPPEPVRPNPDTIDRTWAASSQATSPTAKNTSTLVRIAVVVGLLIVTSAVGGIVMKQRAQVSTQPAVTSSSSVAATPPTVETTPPSAVATAPSPATTPDSKATGAVTDVTPSVASSSPPRPTAPPVLPRAPVVETKRPTLPPRSAAPGTVSPPPATAAPSPAKTHEDEIPNMR